MTLTEFWAATPGEVLRVIKAYGRRRSDQMDLLHIAGSVAASWNAQAVWGRRRDPDLSAVLAEKGASGPIEERLNEQGLKDLAEFRFARDNARFAAMDKRHANV